MATLDPSVKLTIGTVSLAIHIQNTGYDDCDYLAWFADDQNQNSPAYFAINGNVRNVSVDPGQTGSVVFDVGYGNQWSTAFDMPRYGIIIVGRSRDYPSWLPWSQGQMTGFCDIVPSSATDVCVLPQTEIDINRGWETGSNRRAYYQWTGKLMPTTAQWEDSIPTAPHNISEELGSSFVDTCEDQALSHGGGLPWFLIGTDCFFNGPSGGLGGAGLPDDWEMFPENALPGFNNNWGWGGQGAPNTVHPDAIGRTESCHQKIIKHLLLKYNIPSCQATVKQDMYMDCDRGVGIWLERYKTDGAIHTATYPDKIEVIKNSDYECRPWPITSAQTCP